jgi:hypothetical protein
VTKRPHKNTELIQRVLGDNYLRLEIKSLDVEEDLDAELTRVKVRTVDPHGAESTVSGEGVGLVDAIFEALLERYAAEYESLRTLELVNFNIDARIDTANQSHNVDAKGLVTVEVKNSKGTLFTFSDESRSITTSTARAVVAVVEYFVNAERAFITLYNALKDARERNRSDLITRYTRELAEVVKSTSYATIIEKIQKELA